MPSTASGSADWPSRHAAPVRKVRRVLMSLLVAMGLVLVAGTAAGAYYFNRFQGNITSVDITSKLGTNRPAAAPTKDADNDGEIDRAPVNILVMGSDTRAGSGNADIGPDKYGAPRSDTTILVHISGDRKSATGVSIPRDSVVDIPTCTSDDGGVVAARPATMFNEAFSTNPACTVRTVEQLTNVRIDHYVVVDFGGFRSMVNALGGVNVCLKEDVNDSKSKLKLTAGRHTIKGNQALAFVRARHGIGDGSDLSRINRQQAFLSSMIQKATSAGTLTNPIKLVKFLDAATKSLTTDPSLAKFGTLKGLALSVKGMSPSNITFLTIPNEAYPLNVNRVQWREPQADDVWSAVRNDELIPGTKAAKRAAASSPKPTSTGPKLKTRPEAIKVRVVNAAGIDNLATNTRAALEEQGFQVVGIGSTADVQSGTVVRHSAAYDESGRTVAATVTGSTEAVDDSLGSTIELVLGTDFGGVTKLLDSQFGSSPTPSSTATIASRSADQDICA